MHQIDLQLTQEGADIKNLEMYYNNNNKTKQTPSLEATSQALACSWPKKGTFQYILKILSYKYIRANFDCRLRFTSNVTGQFYF